METMSVRLTGIAPLIVHNNQAVDPLNYYAKEMKKISGKRNKTEADHEQLSNLEFFAGLYLVNDIPVVPAKALAATFIKGAMKDKNGPLAKAGVFFSEHAVINHNGPQTPEELWKAQEPYVFRCPVKVGQSTIIRTRPMFEEWYLDVTFEYDNEVIDKAAILLAWEKAGRVVGLCDWRPQHGRFYVQELVYEEAV